MARVFGEGNQRLIGPAVVVLVPLFCLFPFIDKAYHVDDTIGLRVAQQITHKPFDYFGFQMNWYGAEMPVYEFYKNPPGLCYYLALIGALFGWGEVPLHLGLLLMAVAVSVGTYALARELGGEGIPAALVAILTPAFLVSSTNAMNDTAMVAFFVWALAIWVRGLERDKAWLLALSALCMALATMMKYFGLCTIPLAFAYGLARREGVGRWALHLLIPVALVAMYQWYSYRLYGLDLLSSAAGYATEHAFSGQELSMPAMAFTALSFTGGCMASALCFAVLLWGRRALGLWAGLAVLCMGLPLFMKGFLVSEALGEQMELSALSVIFFGLFVVGGLQILALAVLDVWKHRDAVTLLLFLWVLGTFAFSAFLNWTVNGRTLLPMAPAVGILVARRWAEMYAEARDEDGVRWRRWWPMAPAALVALWVTAGDYQLANASRTAAEEYAAAQEEHPGKTYFQGHWGFQYYMEEEGASAVDFLKTVVYDGDVMILPSNNTNLRYLPPEVATPFRTIRVPMTAGVTTINTVLGAGFYSHGYGPLPFVFGRVPSQEFTFYRIGPQQANEGIGPLPANGGIGPQQDREKRPE